MPSFRYEATDALGKIVRGTVEADTERGARNQLRGRGLLPLSTAPPRAREGLGGAARAPVRRRPGLADAPAGQPAGRAPAAGRGPQRHAGPGREKHIATVLLGVRDDVRAGHKLSAALAARPRDFPEIYRALIGAGEESGDLAQVMEKLADYIEERNALRGKVMTAFIYPVVVACVSVIIVVFLLGYVVPQVSAFSHAKQQLPMLTRVMLALSDYVREWGLVTGAALVAAFALWRYAARAGGAHRLARARAAPAAGRALRAGRECGALRIHAVHPVRQRRGAADLAGGRAPHAEQ